VRRVSTLAPARSSRRRTPSSFSGADASPLAFRFASRSRCLREGENVILWLYA
jgi:hypothetical protein